MLEILLIIKIQNCKKNVKYYFPRIPFASEKASYLISYMHLLQTRLLFCPPASAAAVPPVNDDESQIA